MPTDWVVLDFHDNQGGEGIQPLRIRALALAAAVVGALVAGPARAGEPVVLGEQALDRVVAGDFLLVLVIPGLVNVSQVIPGATGPFAGPVANVLQTIPGLGTVVFQLIALPSLTPG